MFVYVCDIKYYHKLLTHPIDSGIISTTQTNNPAGKAGRNELEVNRMAHTRKTKDEYQIWSNYGYGWECECTAEDMQDGRRLLKEYRENGSGVYELKKKRVPLATAK